MPSPGVVTDKVPEATAPAEPAAAAEGEPEAASPAPAPAATPTGNGRLAKNLLMLAGGQLASWAFGVLWLFFVPRILGPTAIGEFVIAISITAVVGIVVNQGAGPLLTREIARDHDRAPALVGAAIVMRLAIAVPAAALMVLYIHFLRFGEEQSILIWLATALVVTASISGALESAFAGVERMEYLAYSSLVGNGLVSVLGIGLVLMGGRVVPLMILDLSLTVLILILNLYWARRLFAIAWRAGARLLPYVVRAGLSFWIGGLFFTAYLWIDSIILSALVPAKVVGWYGVPVQLFSAILMVAGVLGTAWFPRLAAAFVSGAATLQRTGRPAVEAAVVLSLPIGAGIALVAAPAVTLLYGDAFAGSIPVLILFGICVVPTFFNMIAYQILQAEGRQVTWFKVVAIATALNVGCNLVLIPHFQSLGNGAVGAAVSLLITEVFEAAIAMALLPWLLRGPLLARVLRAGVATALMSLVVLAVSPLGLLAEVPFGVATFVLFALLLRLATPEELDLLRGFGGRLRTRLRPGRATG